MRRARTAVVRRAADLADAVTVADAARLLGVCRRTVERYVEAGALRPFYLPSGRPRIPLDEVLRVRATVERPESARCPGRAARARTAR